MNEYYLVLGLMPGATKEEIKNAYRKMAHKYHPDKPGGDEGMMKKINAAYRFLTGKEMVPQPIMNRQPQYSGIRVVYQRYYYGNRGFWTDTSTTAGTSTF